MDKKTELRAKAKELRKKLDIAGVSQKLCEEIRKSLLYKTSENIMIYYPKAEEIDLRALLTDNKSFYLPRVSGDDLEVCPYKSGDELIKSGFGVFEPMSGGVNPQVLDLVIVPALMADRNGYRLGYGGGYYDRFLGLNKNLKTICAIPKELSTDVLPQGDYDIKMDFIITA